MEAKKSLVCKCGKQAKFIQMLTFSYHYCELCKVEVEEPKLSASTADTMYNEGYDLYAATSAAVTGSLTASALKALYGRSSPPPITGPLGGMPAPVPPPAPSTGALPPGYVALKGEPVTCDNCGYLKFFLPHDLAETQLGARAWSQELSDEIQNSAAKHRCNRCGGGYAAHFLTGKLYVRRRGWV